MFMPAIQVQKENTQWKENNYIYKWHSEGILFHF